MEDLLGSNKKIANEIRNNLTKKGILTINLMSSPGSGKTTLLESLAECLSPDYNMAVIEGDIETERDAERIRSKGIPAWQITTGGACHLEAKEINQGLNTFVISAIKGTGMEEFKEYLVTSLEELRAKHA